MCFFCDFLLFLWLGRQNHSSPFLLLPRYVDESDFLSDLLPQLPGILFLMVSWRLQWFLELIWLSCEFMELAREIKFALWFFLETSIECLAGFCSSQWVQTRLLRIIHRPAKQRVIVPGYSPKNLGTNFWNRMVNRLLKHPLACYCLHKWQNDSPLHGIPKYITDITPKRGAFPVISIFSS